MTHFGSPSRRPGSRSRAGRWALPVGTPTQESGGNSGGGLFGTGIGPDFNLGLGQLFQEGGQALSAVASLATPGSKANEPGWGDFGKGFLQSLAGTALTAAKPATELADLLGAGDIESSLERGVGRLWGDEEQFKAYDFFEASRDRGILPALIETVGNVALVAGAPTGALRGASAAARIGGATERAAQLLATRQGLLTRPLIAAAQHPYRTAGKALRAEFAAPAKARLLGGYGVDDITVPESRAAAAAADDLAPAAPEPRLTADTSGQDILTALDTEEPIAPATPAPSHVPPTLTTKILAGIENRMAERETLRDIRHQTRMAEMERNIAARSPAIRASVRAAREHVMTLGKEHGLDISRTEASLIVGDELRARIGGSKAVEGLFLDNGVLSEGDIINTGVRDRFIPQALRTPELEAVLTEAVNAQLVESRKIRDILQSSTKGDKGLTGLADDVATEPGLTKRQTAALKAAEQKLKRAESDVLARKTARESTSRERYVAAETDRLGRIAAESQRIVEQEGQALAEFDRSRAYVPKVWRAAGAVEASAQRIHEQALANIAKNAVEGKGDFGGATYNPHTDRLVEGGKDTGYAVGAIPGTAKKVPLEDFTPDDILQVIRAHQDIYQHPNTTIGVWYQDGNVHIDPGEVVVSRDQALIRAAARKQLAVFDFAGDDEFPGILVDRDAAGNLTGSRADIAAPFVDRNTHLLRRTSELRAMAARTRVDAAGSGITESHVDQFMGLMMARAVAARDMGLVAHPDDFFKTQAPRFKFAAATRGKTSAHVASAIDGLDNAEEVVDLAAELSEITGKIVSPAEVVKEFGKYADDAVSDITLGHLNALVEDAAARVRAGIPLTDTADPILDWFDEAADPVGVPQGTPVARPRRILRKTTDSPTPAPAAVEHPLYGAGSIETMFPEQAPKTVVPWKQAGRLKDYKSYDQAWVDKALAAESPDLLPVDPRGLLATQPSVTRAGVDHYLSGKFEATGKTFADGGKAGNDAPTVYRRPKLSNPAETEDVLLTGHHRAAAALLKGEPLQARIIEGPWGEVRPNRGDVRPIARRVGESVEDIVYHSDATPEAVAAAAARLQKAKARYLLARERINTAATPEEGLRILDQVTSGLRRRAVDNLGPLNAVTIDLPLFQRFKDAVRTEALPIDGATKQVFKVFEAGDFTTLVRADARMLRGMLKPGHVRTVERLYGITDGKWAEGHVTRFADDYVNYLRVGKAPKGLQSTFAAVRDVLRQTWETVKSTFLRRSIDPALAEVFDEYLNPAVKAVPEDIPGLPTSPEPGTLRQRGARPPKFSAPPATGADFYAAGRKGQAALARLEKLAARKKGLTVAAAQSQRRIDAVRTVLNEHRLPSELEADKLRADAARITERVNDQLGRPSIARTPARWQPAWDAYLRLEAEAQKNPAMGEILDDFPQTLHEIQQLALSKGFDPAHIRDFSTSQVRRLVFGSMRLGLGRDLAHEVEAGTRKARTGVLSRAGAVDRSVESFLAATVEAVNEKRTNAVVSHVENTVARTIPKGAVLPPGWALWDPVRTYLLTGTELSDDAQRALTTAAQDSMIVPESVVRTLNRFSKDYEHWAFNAVRKVTSPWRTLVLTMSPGWYVRNVVGNVILAESEGVRLRDWRAAWKSYKSKDEIGHFADLPFVTSDTLAQEAALTADDSIIPRQGFKEARKESGKVRGTLHQASRRMLRVNEVVDEFARAAVYHQGLRRNMTSELAWSRAKEALVDYNGLSPFERSAVRAVIPFYAWQKGILKITVNQVLDHPARTGIIMLLGRMQDEYIADRFGVEGQDVPDYYKNLVGDYNIRSFNPFSDPSEIVTLEGITRSMNPFIELAVRKGLGAPEFYSDKQRLSFFGTPQADVDVGTELTEMLTRSPGGRILSEGPGSNLLGLSPVDDTALRSRFLRARRQIRDIPNPETLLPTGR